MESACLECKQAITSPICAECLTGDIRRWIEEENPNLIDRVVENDPAGGISCLQCDNEMGVCAHCFTKEIYLSLVEADPSVARKFLNHFDFQLRRELLS